MCSAPLSQAQQPHTLGNALPIFDYIIVSKLLTRTSDHVLRICTSSNFRSMAALVCCEDAGTKFVTDGAISKLLTGAKFVSGGTANVSVPRGDLLLALAATQQQQSVKDFSTTKRSKVQRQGLLQHRSKQHPSSLQQAMQLGAFRMNDATSMVHNLQRSRSGIPQQVRGHLPQGLHRVVVHVSDALPYVSQTARITLCFV